MAVSGMFGNEETMKRLTVFFLLSVFVGNIAAAQAMADSAKIYFRPGHSKFDPVVRDNYNVMKSFVEEVRRQYSDDNIECLTIRSYTSPDGVSTVNDLVSEKRCKAIAAYIVQETKISPELIGTVPEGIAWDEFRAMVADNADIPDRDKVLGIIDNTPVWVVDSRHNIVGSRKKSLMDLNGGETYRWLLDNLFPELRYVSLELHLKDSIPAPTQALESSLAEKADTLQQYPTGFPLPVHQDKPAKKHQRTEKAHKCRFALKTNVLYLPILMPSLEFEWRMGNYLSMSIEGDIAWWKDRERHKCYQLAVVSPEIRVWFRGDSMRRGLYAGLLGGIGLYDLENGTKGYRGEGVMAGLCVGYMWPIGKSFAIDAEIGGGWMNTVYKEYRPYEGHHIYIRSFDTDYYGPLKCKLSLVWRFGKVGPKQGGGK